MILYFKEVLKKGSSDVLEKIYLCFAQKITMFLQKYRYVLKECQLVLKMNGL
jgi:hypothetical protein